MDIVLVEDGKAKFYGAQSRMFGDGRPVVAVVYKIRRKQGHTLKCVLARARARFCWPVEVV